MGAEAPAAAEPQKGKIVELDLGDFKKELVGQFNEIVKEAIAPLTKVDRRWGDFPGLTEEQIDKMGYLEKFG